MPRALSRWTPEEDEILRREALAQRTQSLPKTPIGADLFPLNLKSRKEGSSAGTALQPNSLAEATKTAESAGVTK